MCTGISMWRARAAIPSDLFAILTLGGGDAGDTIYGEGV